MAAKINARNIEVIKKNDHAGSAPSEVALFFPLEKYGLRLSMAEIKSFFIFLETEYFSFCIGGSTFPFPTA